MTLAVSKVDVILGDNKVLNFGKIFINNHLAVRAHLLTLLLLVLYLVVLSELRGHFLVLISCVQPPVVLYRAVVATRTEFLC